MPRLKREGELGTSRAAAYLGIHRSTLTDWRLRGEFPPTSVLDGPRWPLYMYSIGDLDQFKERIDYDA